MDGPSPRFESSRWFWSAAIWSGIGLFDATQNVFVMRAEGMHHAWARLFACLLLAWLPWALATPLVLGLERQFPSGPMAARLHLGRSSDRMRHRRFDFGHMDRVTGSAAESLGPCSRSRTIRAALVTEVLQ